MCECVRMCKSVCVCKRMCECVKSVSGVLLKPFSLGVTATFLHLSLSNSTCHHFSHDTQFQYI